MGKRKQKESSWMKKKGGEEKTYAAKLERKIDPKTLEGNDATWVKYEKMAADDKLRYKNEKEKSVEDSGTETILTMLQKTGATTTK